MSTQKEYTAEKIHPTAFVHENATLYGDITLGEYASIWPGVVLRADMNAFV
ncbi:MAG TPA: hypothetical protein PLY93_13330, partial [Turneriella sp.]|nr:hypothetical protein [Turneriella sp.]